MKRTHLPLNALRVFDAAARHLSFTKAADELAVTPAAVGQQIRSLEELLGVVLFKRLTRSLELTPEGEAALPALRQGFASFEESVAIMQRQQGSKVLTIGHPADLPIAWLSERLGAAHDALGQPELRFLPYEGELDFSQANLDIAIQIGGAPSEELKAAALDFGPIVLCGRNGLGLPDAADGVGAMRRAVDIRRGSSHWEDWFKAAGVNVGSEPGPAITTSGLLHLIEAAAGGALALLPRTLAEADARLTILLPEVTAGSLQAWLVAPEPQWRQAKVERMRKLLLDTQDKG